MNPEESMMYRKSLLERSRASLSEEEKTWLECNPAYSRKYGTDYYRKDVINIEPNIEYHILLTCLHYERSFPIVPTLAIPECHKGYIMLDESFYREYPQIKAKKSTKLSVRLGDRLPGHFLVQSDGGMLIVSFQCWIPETDGLSRWWESTAFPDLAMTREMIAPNKIQYGCNAAGNRKEFIESPSGFDKFIFSVEWTPVES